MNTVTELSKTKQLTKTTSLCSQCKQGVTAEIVEIDGKIFMQKFCPEHGAEDILIASDSAWYHDVMQYNAVLSAPKIVKNEVKTGCPFDCGACTSHEQQVYLPVIPITSVCNLDCPICYTINNNKGAYHISLEEFSKMLAVIKENDPNMTIINLTGGEPTMHPKLRDIIRLCHEAGIHRVTISTHGLTFIRNEQLLADLAKYQARIVLSFNSFDESTNEKMLGKELFARKMAVLEQLEKYDVDTTLIPVIAKGVNAHEVGKLIDLALTRNFIRSLEIHTMTFTGQGGTDFDSISRITTPEVLDYIENQTHGLIQKKDFVPSPCAHPLCYQCCYLLKLGDNEYIPFTRFMSKDKIRYLLTDNLYMEPGEKLESVLKDVINELWLLELEDELAQKVLKAIKKIILDLYGSPISYAEQQLIAERSAKTIYIHSHMDENNFDTDRIKQCCVGVPTADGGNTPTCSYNILYRGRDENFSKKNLKPIAEFTGGRKW